MFVYPFIFVIYIYIDRLARAKLDEATVEKRLKDQERSCKSIKNKINEASATIADNERALTVAKKELADLQARFVS